MTGACDATLPSPFVNNANPEGESVESIDRELAKCHALMLNLKTRRNEIVPISRLPPEVLCIIFFFSSRLRNHDVQWIQITHVCRHWRGLALQSPSLWANPPLKYKTWTEVFVSRSKMAGLTLQIDDSVFDSSPNSLQNFFDVCQNNNTRLKCIQLEFYSLGSLWLQKLPSSAPMLESLVITIYPCTRLSSYYNKCLGDDLLCDMGRLRRMVLTGISINWDLHLPSTLTILKLHTIPLSGTPEMDKIKDALERLPLLQTLDLSDALPEIAKPSLSSRNINLPNLQILKLSAGIAEAECLLRALTFPATTFVQIVCKQTNINSYFDVTGISSSLARCRKDFGMQIKILNLNLETDIPTDFRLKFRSAWKIQAFTSIRKPSRTDYERTLPIDLKFAWYQERGIKTGKVLGELLHGMPLDNVRNLSLNGSADSLSVRTILDTVGALPRVRTFTADLGANVVRALKSHLQRVPGHSATPSQISFPSLRNLMLKGDFTEEFDYETGDVTVGILLDCLEWRSKCGTAVKWLNLEECKGIDIFEVDRLENVVEEVVWDPDLDSDEEEDEDIYSHGNDTEEGDEDDEEEDSEEEEDEEEEEQDLFQDGYHEPELGLHDLFDSDDPDIMGFEDFY